MYKLDYAAQASAALGLMPERHADWILEDAEKIQADPMCFQSGEEDIAGGPSFVSKYKVTYVVLHALEVVLVAHIENIEDR